MRPRSSLGIEVDWECLVPQQKSPLQVKLAFSVIGQALL